MHLVSIAPFGSLGHMGGKVAPYLDPATGVAGGNSRLVGANGNTLQMETVLCHSPFIM